MKKIKYLVFASFIGTGFCGFQTQKPGLKTIQNVLQLAISKITEESSFIKGCSRTDTGVNAINMPFTFEINYQIEVI